MERVRTALRTKAELCSLSDLYGDALANGRNDISTLSREFGWDIRTSRTAHGQQSHVHYQLVREGRTERAPRGAIQQRLITT
jgi:hypothetical protein